YIDNIKNNFGKLKTDYKDLLLDKGARKTYFRSPEYGAGFTAGVGGLFYQIVDKKTDETVGSGGNVLADMSGNFNATLQGMAGPVPVYAYGEVGVEGEVEIPVAKDKDGDIVVTGSNITITPYINPEAGIGVCGGLSLGLYGNLNFPTTIMSGGKTSEFGVELGGELGVHLQALYTYEQNYKIVEIDPAIPIYPRPDQNNGSSAPVPKAATFSAAPVEGDDGTMKVMNMSTYNNVYSDWNQTGDKDENTLLDSSLISSTPVQKVVDGKNVMVFQAYDSSRTLAENSCVLMYSVKGEDNTWSVPKPVWDKNNSKKYTSDYFADMKVIDGKLVLAWQKAKAELSSGAKVEDALSKTEICMAIFDPQTETFVKQKYITSNGNMDFAPQVVNSDDKIAVTWVRNSKSSLTGIEGENTLYVAEYNQDTDKFEKEQIVVKSKGTIEKYAPYYSEGKVQATYVCTKDDINAIYDTETKLTVRDLQKFVKGEGAGQIANLTYNNGQIELVTNGSVYRYDLTSQKVEKVSDDKATVGSTAQYVSNGQKSAYVWSSYNKKKEKYEIVASVYGANGYSKKVTLFETDKDICRYLAPILDESGNWNIVANVEKEDGNGKLVSYNKSNEQAIEVTSVQIDEEDVNENGEKALTIGFNNIGDNAIDKIFVKTNLNDEPIEIGLDTPVAKNQSASVKKYIDFGTAKEVEVYVYVDEANVSTFTLKIGVANVSVVATGKNSADDVIITATVKNDGPACEADVVLNDLNSNKECKNEKITLAEQEEKTVVMTVSKDKIKYVDGKAKLLVNVNSTVFEADFTDNTATVEMEKKVVEINGFQINPTVGIRTIYSTNYSSEDVLNYGLIYGWAKKGATKDDMVVNSSSEFVSECYGTPKGKSSANFSDYAGAQSYVMTLEFGKNTKTAYTMNYYVRAFVVLADGSCEYSEVKEYSAYEIAKELYESGKIENKQKFDDVYAIIKSVDPEYKQIDYDWNNTTVDPKNKKDDSNIEISGFSISTTAMDTNELPGGLRMIYSTKYNPEDIENVGMLFSYNATEDKNYMTVENQDNDLFKV
ncbi:MAG: hypothetical protein IKN54_07630, partial [Lachnospiraceae bacterium]|nr:hypothetical protein [Lachnospiraceae bacterium]